MVDTDQLDGAESHTNKQMDPRQEDAEKES